VQIKAMPRRHSVLPQELQRRLGIRRSKLSDNTVAEPPLLSSRKSWMNLHQGEKYGLPMR
jgi:hypothetical protein